MQPKFSTDAIKEFCYEREFLSYGTTRIFEKRAHSTQKKITLISFFGLINPLLIGGVVLAFGTSTSFLPILIAIASLCTVIQLILSAWSIVFKWDDKFAYSTESTNSNTTLYNKFRKIPQLDPSIQNDQFTEANWEYEERERNDLRQAISEKEKRFANRSALIYYKKSCHLCKETPTTMKPSKCDSCGNF